MHRIRPFVLAAALLPCAAAAQSPRAPLAVPLPVAPTRMHGAPVAPTQLVPRTALHQAAFAQDADSAARRRQAFLGGVMVGTLAGAVGYGLWLRAIAHPDDGAYPSPVWASVWILGGAAFGGIVATEIHDVRERRQRR